MLVLFRLLAVLFFVACSASVGHDQNQCKAGGEPCGNGVGGTQLHIKHVARRSNLDLPAFIRNYEAKHLPVVITDYGERIIGPDGLSLETIKHFCADALFAPYVYNSSSTDWASMDKMPGMTVSEFLAYFQRESKSPTTSRPLYMLDWALLNGCPELGQTLTIPKYVVRDAQKLLLSEDMMLQDVSDSPWPSLFMSPSTLHGSGLHIDGGNSSFWMYLVQGRKRWRIVSATNVKHLGVRLDPTLVTPSLEADLFEPEFHKFPELSHIDIWEADISPGDLIIIPSGSAHQVRNLDPSIAIAGNYVSPHGLQNYKSFLQHLFKLKLGEEKDWPDHVFSILNMYGHKQFFKDVNAVFPKTDLSFDSYHAGFSLPGW